MAGENDNAGADHGAGGADNAVVEDRGAVVVDTGGEGGAPEPDDGLTAEERGQFNAMRDGGAPGADVGGADTVAGGAGDAAARKPEAGADDDDDDHDGEVEAKPGSQPALGADGKPAKLPRRVSYSRWQKAQDEIVALKKKLDDDGKLSAENQARLDERLRIINEALAPKPKAADAVDDDPEPDPDEDFLAHGKWMRRELARTQAALKEAHKGIETVNVDRQNEAQQSQIVQAYDADASTFARTEPNFVPGYQWLMANRIAELAVYKYGKDMTEEGARLTPAELNWIKGVIQGEENDIVTMALKEGKSPAERIYKLAKARGYRPPAPVPQNGAGKPGNGAAQNGGKVPGSLADAAAAADVAGAARSSVSEEIAKVRKGVEDSTSLSTGGGAPSIVLTPERLANMPQDEFSALLERLSPEELRLVTGGPARA